jgi:hypothetical protein
MDESTKPAVPLLAGPNLAGIEVARKVLGMLERGEIVSIAVIGEKADGATCIYDAQGNGDLVKLLGAATLLVRRLTDRIVDGGKRAVGQFSQGNGS